MRYCAFALLGAAACCCLCLPEGQSGPPKQKLLIAFASYRDRPRHPKIYLYEHDGAANGKVIDSFDTVNNRSDYHPSLSADGRYCAFATEMESKSFRILVWDVRERKPLPLAALNDVPNAQLQPSLSGDGRLLVFAAWNQPGSSQRWDLLAYDVPGQKFLAWPNLNTPAADERMPCLSGDGKWLAFAANRKDGAGLTDIWLYSIAEAKLVPLPGLNSPGLDITPSLNHDGSLIAFASDRPGGQGGRDIYLYDRKAEKMLDLPGLNSPAQEQTPSLSPDGRFLAFVSERFAGPGERDLYLYDRQTQKLLATPGLNSNKEDIDPCVIGLKASD